MAGMAAAIKSRLTAPEVARFYGFEPSRAGFIRCPFHEGDDTGSLKLYDGDRGWHCFGCGAGSTVIDFVMRLFGLPFWDACLRLNRDFHLGLSADRPPSPRELACLDRERQLQQAEKARRQQELWALCDEHRRCWDALKYCPKPSLGADGRINMHPLYEEALIRLPYLDYLINEMMDGRRAVGTELFGRGLSDSETV